MASRAFGTKVLTRLVGASTWVNIGLIKDLDGPQKSRDSIDVTTHDSANFYTEKLPGLKDGGPVSFEIEFSTTFTAADPAVVGLDIAFEADALYEFAVKPPTGLVNGYEAAVADKFCHRFTGFVTKIGPTYPVAGSIRQSIEITVSGKPTFTPWS